MLFLVPLAITFVNGQGYVTVTLQSTLTRTSNLTPIFNGPFKVDSTLGSSQLCGRSKFTFQGSQGQYVSGNFTSIIPLDLYILSDGNFQNWMKVGGCGGNPASILSRLNSTAFVFNVALPSTGAWDIVFVNYSSSRDASGYLAANLSSGAITVTDVLVSTITSNIFTSETTNTTPSPSIPGFPLESIAVGIVIGVIALLLLNRRKNHKEAGAE